MAPKKKAAKPAKVTTTKAVAKEPNPFQLEPGGPIITPPIKTATDKK